jgi:hypothetical protein
MQRTDLVTARASDVTTRRSAGAGVVVPGMKNELMAQSVRISPRVLVTAIVRRMNG